MYRKMLGLLVFSLVLFSGSCKKVENLTGIKMDALAMLGKYLPELDTLNKKIGTLLGRANALPADLPGASEIVEKLAAHKKTLAGFSKLVEGAPEKIEAAMKGGDKIALLGLLGNVKDVGAALPNIATALTDTERNLGVLEKKNVAPPPPAPEPDTEE